MNNAKMPRSPFTAATAGIPFPHDCLPSPMCPRRWVAEASPGLRLPVKFLLDFRRRHRRAGQSAGHREQRRLFTGAPPRQKREIIHHLPERGLGKAVEFLDNRFFQRVHMLIPYHVAAPWETRKCKPKKGPKRGSGGGGFVGGQRGRGDGGRQNVDVQGIPFRLLSACIFNHSLNTVQMP